MKNSVNRLAEYQKERSREGVDRVRGYFESNPFSNVKECARDLEMNYDTVARYVRKLRAERVRS